MWFTSNGSGTLDSSLVFLVDVGFRIVSSIDWSDRRVPCDFSPPELTERVGSIRIFSVLIKQYSD